MKNISFFLHLQRTQVQSQHPRQEAHNYLYLQVQVLRCPLLDSEGTCTSEGYAHRHMNTDTIIFKVSLWLN